MVERDSWGTDLPFQAPEEAKEREDRKLLMSLHESQVT